jgi:hypothetical protein
MTLDQAIEAYPEVGFNPGLVARLQSDDEEAFQTCLLFLEGVEKSKGQNRSHDSYGYKHIVENPTGHFDIPRSFDGGKCYIPEGAFILAALASGFTMQPIRVSARFNISEGSLRRRANEWSARVMAQKQLSR